MKHAQAADLGEARQRAARAGRPLTFSIANSGETLRVHPGGRFEVIRPKLADFRIPTYHSGRLGRVTIPED